MRTFPRFLRALWLFLKCPIINETKGELYEDLFRERTRRMEAERRLENFEEKLRDALKRVNREKKERPTR